MNFLKAHGHNTTILWRKDLPVECGWMSNNWVETPGPWVRSSTSGASDGGNKWDLNTFNQPYFDRLLTRVQQLQQNGIYATVELFDGNNLASARCGNNSPGGDGFLAIKVCAACDANADRCRRECVL